MIEVEWLTSDDPKAMLKHIAFQIAETSYALVPGVSERKLRLFAEEAGCPECARLAAHQHQAAADYAEYVAGDSYRTRAEKAAILRDIFGNPFRPVSLKCTRCEGDGKAHGADRPFEWNPDPDYMKCPVCKGDGRSKELRPWLSWHDGLIPAMARTIYDERQWWQMGPLADALEEAGCTDDNVLMHLRGWEPFGDPDNPGWKRWGIDGKPIKHVRGCWVIDLLLGNE